MLARPTLILSLALALLTASANAGPLVYVVTFNGQFGAPSPGEFGSIDPTTVSITKSALPWRIHSEG